MSEVIEAKSNDLKKYLGEILQAEKEQKEYIKRAKSVVERYRDEDRLWRKSKDALPARYNILWSNTETVMPALFNRIPRVQVDRRFKDNDPVSRVACEIWERAVQFSIEDYDFEGMLRACVKDYLLASRGTAWVRYDPTVQNDQITFQRVLCDHVHFSDFLHSPAKQWKNVRGVGRKIYLNRRQLVDRFGKVGKEIQLDYSGKDSDESSRSNKEEGKQATIYEWWCADSMQVVWLSKTYPKNVLDMIEDPLGLQGFFPTPKPLFGTTTTETLIPIPDYCMYQDQARELDMITMKISLLTDALRLVGVYDASFAQLQTVLSSTNENLLIPLPNWQKFQSQGGFDGVMQWMTLKDIVGALQQLYDSRDRIKAQIDEITGVADILRGATSPIATTATEQQIKGQFATLRLSERQREVQRYARDLIAMQGEIIAENFTPETLAMMSGYDTAAPDVQQQFMQAVALLQSDPMRSFKIDIETDSMVAVDEALDKQKTTEFLSTVGSFLQSAVQATQQAPVLAPVMSEMLMFAARRYRGGRALENSIEQAGQGLIQMAQAAMSAPPQQDPAMVKAQAEIQLEQIKSQNDFQLKQAEIQQKAEAAAADNAQKMAMHQRETESRMLLKQQEAQQSLQLDRERMENDLILAREKMQFEMELEAAKLAQQGELENKQALLKSGLPDLHITSTGAITTKPPVVKEGEFFTDPETGNRRVRIIEQTLEQ